MEDEGATGGNWNELSPEVLDMIFKHLPVPDLLSCSVVTKNWKKAARDVLKRSRECYAHVKYFHQDIQDLNEMIASTDIMESINGLHIRNEKIPKEEPDIRSKFWENSNRRLDVTKLLQSEEAIRQRLEEAKLKILAVLSGQWRYLDLDMGREWIDTVSLDKGLLLREIVLATSDSLQKLVIGQDRDWKFIPCCGTPFPKLKVIQPQEEDSLRCCSTLSSFAPKLEKITGALMNLEVEDQVERFQLERIKSIRVQGDLTVPQGEAREVFGCVAGLYRLDLQQYHYEQFHGDDDEEQDLPSWHSFVFPFLLRSLNTLKELRMYTQELNNLSMASSGLLFPNLRRLSLAIDGDVSVANEIWNLNNLNLPKLCPNLEQLELMEATCTHEVQDDQPVPDAEPDGLDQSEMPVAIDLKCHSGLDNHHDGMYNHEYLEFFLTIYPKLSNVRILNLRNVLDYDMSKIFWEVQSLERLEIQVCRPPYEVDIGMEALLCGINIEEAQLPLLKYQKKNEKLSSCIVPIRPSLLNAKSLKELKITEEPLTCENLLMVRRRWVTQITENLPERHVRNMTVTFDGSKGFYDRLNRMRALTWLRANKSRARHPE